MIAGHPSLLVVDDEPGILDVVGRCGRKAGFDVSVCSGGREAIARIREQRPDLILIDVRMPTVGGIDVLRAIKEIDPHCQAVLMTGYATVETAVEAIKLGAMDYLNKPLDLARLDRLLNGVREEIERRRAVLSIEGDLARRLEFAGMIGRGPAMQDLFGMIRRLAPHVPTALITGEAGTGKELAARALHRMGPRRERRLVTVNCTTATAPQFESELFGQVRGAFSGATENRPGLFELADGGTLFLDDIGELPLTVQTKLLRVVEVGEVHRLGSLEPRRVNVHVIAGSSRDLRAAAAAGRFRSDLYYRLNMVELKLPPLRNRTEDIPYLTAAFVREASDRLQKPLLGLTPGAERLLAGAYWPGNVRELRNVIDRASLLADGEFITERDVASSMPANPVEAGSTQPACASQSSESSAQRPVGDSHGRPGTGLLVDVEREHIRRALERAGGNKKAAAQMLGLSRRALYRRLERLNLSDTICRRGDGEMLEV